MLGLLVRTEAIIFTNYVRQLSFTNVLNDKFIGEKSVFDGVIQSVVQKQQDRKKQKQQQRKSEKQITVPTKSTVSNNSYMKLSERVQPLVLKSDKKYSFASSPKKTSHDKPAKTSSIRENWFKIDNDLSNHLQALLRKNNNGYAFQLFQQGILQLNVPKFEVLVVLASAAVSSGNAQILESVQSVSRLIFPEEFQKHAGFKVNQIEMLWKHFNYKEACLIFWDIYSTHPNVRRKLRNAYSFMVMHAVLNNNKSEVDFILIEKLADDLMIHYTDAQPLVSLWKHCMKSLWFRHQEVAARVETKLQTDPEFKHLVLKRIRSILEEIERDELSLDLLHRLVQTCLKLELDDVLPLAVGKLLESQCIHGRYREADETMKLCEKLKILLPYDSCAVYSVHLHKRKRQKGLMIPDDLKDPNIVPPTKFKFQF